MKISLLPALTSFTVLIVVLSTVLAEDKDPDDDLTYEAKLLDRMIRMEARMEQLDKTLSRTKAEFKFTIEDQTKVFDNKTKEIEQLQGKMIGSL